MRATRALIHLDNLAHNIREMQKLTAPGTKICVPVKADAYGHGAVECAKTALKSGADCLGVATADEGHELRGAVITAPVLLFTLPDPQEIAQCVHDDLEPFVYTQEIIALFDAEAAAQNKTVKVHLKIDTGMGRAGCRPEDASLFAKNIARLKNIRIAGVCTHFAVSDSLQQDDIAFTQKQFSLFLQVVDSIKEAGIDPGIRHCAASGATLLSPHTHLDMVRPGIAVYGYYPGDYLNGKAELAARTTASLKPVMELVTSIIARKTIHEGESVSYGRTWTAEREQKIAVLPLGYGDGLRRSFSPRLIVSHNGTARAIAGRICMDQCMILLDDDAQSNSDPHVIIFGDTRAKTNSAFMDAGFLAEIAGTIPYEILCGISKRVPRVYVA